MNTFQPVHYVGVIGTTKYDVEVGVAGWQVLRRMESKDTEVLTYDGTWARVLNTGLKDYMYFHSENKAFDFIKNGTLPAKTLVDLLPK